jgi:hypothetical protein
LHDASEKIKNVDVFFSGVHKNGELPNITTSYLLKSPFGV